MIYSCIDIGSDTIKLVVGKIENNNINILASVNTRMSGIKKGIIVDPSLVEESINLLNLEAEKILGFKIDRAIINVPFYDVEVDSYNGLSYSDGEINGDDVITCFKSSVSTISTDKEVISVCPIHFIIDNEKKTDNPIGMTGEKLECKMLISTVPKKNIYPLLEILDKCHIEVIDLSFDVVNAYYNLDREEFKSGCGAVIDLGASTCKVGIFNKGLLIKGEVYPYGSKLIDNDIRYIYKIDKATARNLKETFAFAYSQYANESEVLEYLTVDNEKILISQKEISEVVEARLVEILKSVKKGLNNLTNHEISYIIVTGGISNMPAFKELLDSIFKNASIINVDTIGVRNNIYTNSVGMLKYYYDKLKIRGIDYTMYERIESSNKKIIHEKIIEEMKKYCEDN